MDVRACEMLMNTRPVTSDSLFFVAKYFFIVCLLWVDDLWMCGLCVERMQRRIATKLSMLSGTCRNMQVQEADYA